MVRPDFAAAPGGELRNDEVITLRYRLGCGPVLSAAVVAPHHRRSRGL
jgi:hypothetical protein